jgi:membrane fusion protein, multidrug efflux system
LSRRLRYRIGNLLLFLTLLLVASGCGRDRESADREERTVSVETFRVEGMDFPETLQGIGSLESSEAVIIRPEIAGTITDVPFEEGQQVSEGELLFVLRDEKLRQELQAQQAELQSARSSLEQARQTFERFSTLFEAGLISAEEHDQTRTDMETARAEVQRLSAQVALSEERLEDTRIRAPMDGAISESRVDPGDYVSVGEELAVLYTATALQVGFSVPEQGMGRVRPGQSVVVTVPAIPERRFNGQVIFVSPVVDVRTRTLHVKATVEDESGTLKPGAFAGVSVTVDVRSRRPAVPESALVAAREAYFIYLVDQDSIARSREIAIGLRRTGYVEIDQGIDIGDLVVSSGQMRLSDGDAVEVVAGPAPSTPEGNGTTGKGS